MIEQGSHAELLDKEDGTYARLVKIQTQVSKDPNVDKLLTHAEDDDENEGEAKANSDLAESLEASADDPQSSQDIRWLDAASATFTVAGTGVTPATAIGK